MSNSAADSAVLHLDSHGSQSNALHGAESHALFIMDLQEGAVPFTYRFLGLRLRLAFTKRRFERVEARYHQHLTLHPRVTTQATHDNDPNDQTHAVLQQNARMLNEVTEMLEASFSSLRDEIDRIEKGQESMKKRALPRVQEQLRLRQGYVCFLGGFLETENNTSPLKQLNCGEETTIAIKQLIAEFAGVPRGPLLRDLQSLELLLLQEDDCESHHHVESDDIFIGADSAATSL